MAAPSNSPADRPTEWVTAIAGIITAVLAFNTDHNTAGFVAAVGAFLPTIITLIKETWPSKANTP